MASFKDGDDVSAITPEMLNVQFPMPIYFNFTKVGARHNYTSINMQNKKNDISNMHK